MVAARSELISLDEIDHYYLFSYDVKNNNMSKPKIDDKNRDC
ncbi:hypothetical protein NTGBS_780034 [Candidatus Nitrotoga sp. BS]|nr:hypothetical protein NTGBS_780034 [Candidatus Nitrotoga sp. BS]